MLLGEVLHGPQWCDALLLHAQEFRCLGDQVRWQHNGLQVVRPDSLWSLAGLKFILSGYIPVSQWTQTLFSWLSLVALILIGSLAINVIMRKQWIEHERLVFPLLAPVLDMTEGPRTGLPGFLRNRLFWLGFGVAFGAAARAACGNRVPRRRRSNDQ